MKDKVFTILLCYNTPHERLKEIIESIINQTYEVYKILIWDNASSNKIEEFLLQKGFLNNSKIIYIKSDQNLGAGGGFSSAMDYIKKKFNNYEWIWLIEDDVSPEKDCLEKLLLYKNISSILIPRRKFLDGEILDDETILIFPAMKFLNMNNISIKNNKKFTFVFTHTFEGLLINKNLIKQIGYPPSENFLLHDDTIYTLKTWLYDNPVLVNDAFLITLKNKELKKDLLPRHVYYMNRNLFLVKEFLVKNNLLNKKETLIFNILFVYRFLKYSLLSIFKFRSFKALYLVFRAFYDGINKKFGRVF
jgi:GT2 family glycosyltransferase